MKPAGYIVMESSEDYEQALRLVTGDGLPSDGILEWRDRKAATMFTDRKAAQAAIIRTEHYRLAFGITALPEKRFCKIMPVEMRLTPEVTK